MHIVAVIKPVNRADSGEYPTTLPNMCDLTNSVQEGEVRSRMSVAHDFYLNLC